MGRSTANGLMLLAALIWGTSFVAQQLGMHHIGPLAFTGIRFLLGALFILPLALREARRLRRQRVVIGRRDTLAWFGLGLLLFGGAAFQQIGMLDTTVTNAGFLTALYLPMVPLLAWIIDRQRPPAPVWLAIGGSCLGTVLLGGGGLATLNSGDAWIIASAVFWAAHVLFVGRVAAQKGAPILVAFTQFVVCGVLACLLALPSETISGAGLVAALPAILYSGLLSVGVAFTLQVLAQRHTRPADAAILLSSETLFAAIAGALVLGERLDATRLAGCGLIFGSILAVQLLPSRLPVAKAAPP